VPLPVDLDDPVARLSSLSAATSQLKSGPQGAGMATVLRSADWWPPAMLAAAGRLIGHQPFVNLVVTNVRGSDERLQLLGAPLREITPIVPLGRNLAVGVAALSYAGTMVISVNMDAGSGFDADHVASLLEHGLAELQEPTRHAPPSRTRRRSRPAAQRSKRSKVTARRR
jgi:hypothetical protein